MSTGVGIFCIHLVNLIGLDLMCQAKTKNGSASHDAWMGCAMDFDALAQGTENHAIKTIGDDKQ